MKIPLGIQFLTAAALALLFLPPSATASGAAEATPADVDPRVCSEAQDAATLMFSPLDPLMASEPVRPPEKIIDGPCSWCTPSSPCERGCVDENEEQTNCGDYGVCDWCTTGIVETGRELIGQTAREKFWGVCEFTKYYTVTFQSLNHGCQPFTKCEHDTTTRLYWVGVYCCDKYGGCWGQTC